MQGRDLLYLGLFERANKLNMLRKPIVTFLIALVVLLVLLEVPGYLTLPDWITLVGLLVSYKMAFISMRNGLKKKDAFLFNVIAVVGSIGILIILTFFAILFLISKTGGLPGQD